MNNLDHIKSLKQLLRVTIDDVKLVRNDERYSLNMELWHNPNTLSEECAVCLAGSVMAKTLKSDIDVGIAPWYFDKRTNVLLLLIDRIRVGHGVSYIQNFLKTNKIEFDLNNLDSLDLNNYDLGWGAVYKWENLYNDLV